MDLISQHKVFHGGTYNTNRVAMAAGLATFRESSRARLCARRQTQQESHEGYRAIVKKSGLQACIASAGVNAVDALPKEIQTTATGTKIDVDLWQPLLFAMVNRACWRSTYCGTSSGRSPCSTREADIDKHSSFEEIAPACEGAGRERGLAFVGAAGH